MIKANLVFDEKSVYTLNSLPADDGKIIYVFRDTSDSNDGKWIIHKVLYIGISIDASGRLNTSHNKIEPAKKLLANGHFLTFAYYKFDNSVSEKTIRAIENALIYSNKPCLNDNNKDNYHFEEYGNIEVHCSGHRSTKLVKDIQLLDS